MTIISGGTDLRLDMNRIVLLDFFRLPAMHPSSAAAYLDGDEQGMLHVTGSNLAYDSDGHIVSGTVTGFSLADAGHLIADYSGFSFDAAQLHDWAASRNLAFYDALQNGNDTITGTPLDDYVEGFGGHDVLNGGAGADVLIGGDGNDHLYGQSPAGGPDGNDSLSGGNGSDYLQGNAGDDFLDGGAGSDRIFGGAGNDLIMGGIGNDTINGNRGDDYIQGGDGNDALRGGQGNDSIGGGAGDDVISGDLGNDTIIGGDGDDTMTGGAGADIFSFNEGFPRDNNPTEADVITDYESGVDHLSIPQLYQNLANYFPIKDLGETSDSLSAMRMHALSAVTAGAMAVYHEDGDTYLLWQSKGSPIFNHALILLGEHTITAADFI